MLLIARQKTAVQIMNVIRKLMNFSQNFRIIWSLWKSGINKDVSMDEDMSIMEFENTQISKLKNISYSFSSKENPVKHKIMTVQHLRPSLTISLPLACRCVVSQ